MMNMGMKTNAATMTECVGPRCISEPVKKSKIMSMSGRMEKTSSMGMLSFMRNAFEEPFA